MTLVLELQPASLQVRVHAALSMALPVALSVVPGLWLWQGYQPAEYPEDILGQQLALDAESPVKGMIAEASDTMAVVAALPEHPGKSRELRSELHWTAQR
mmetsp:Transcript_151747/g.276113  ORF Transcript_151747/g.276113 Transcript_151747/m.276113 type:complete len:100 (+) Transcript_151747:86-385(+)